MLKINVLLLFILGSIFPVMGEENYREQMKKKLTELGQLTPDNYFEAIDKYRNDVEKYIENKKRVCNGEFSTFILDQETSETQSKQSTSLKKLSREERKLCFRELKLIQTSYIENMFQARLRYLKSIHNTQVEELTEAKNKALFELQRSFDKKLPKKKRRR